MAWNRNSPFSTLTKRILSDGPKAVCHRAPRDLTTAVLAQRTVLEDRSLIPCTRLACMLESQFLEQTERLCLVNKNTKLDLVLELMQETN